MNTMNPRKTRITSGEFMDRVCICIQILSGSWLSALVVLSVFTSACGKSKTDIRGGNQPSSGSPSITIAVTPKTATVVQNNTQEFSAVVSGASNTAVTWSVTEAGGGSVSAGGLYSAPGASGVYHVVATSQATPAVSDTATITVIAPVPAVVNNPRTRTLESNAQLQFSAVVGGATNTGVTWSIAESGGGGITGSGLYTAPSATGVYHVVVTTQATPAAGDSATITVVTPGTYITPGNITGDVIVTMDSHTTSAISPFIYGLNVAELSGPNSNWGTYLPKFTFNRYGGNNTTALNWETGYTNCGADCSGYPNYDHPLYTVNGGANKQPVGPGNAITPRIDFAHARNAAQVITVPILGFVARDASGAQPIPAAPNATTPATPSSAHWLQALPSNPAGATTAPNVSDDFVYTDDLVKWMDAKYPNAKTDSVQRKIR